MRGRPGHPQSGSRFAAGGGAGAPVKRVASNRQRRKKGRRPPGALDQGGVGGHLPEGGVVACQDSLFGRGLVRSLLHPEQDGGTATAARCNISTVEGVFKGEGKKRGHQGPRGSVTASRAGEAGCCANQPLSPPGRQERRRRESFSLSPGGPMKSHGKISSLFLSLAA